MRTRGRTWAYLLRGLGLAITLAGLIATIASLSQTWVRDSSGNGPAEQSGWAFGLVDAALVGGCVLVAILAIALCVGPRSRKVSRSAGAFAFTILGLALAGIGLTDWLVGLDF
jgi:TRAP-type C4-dicarboxylate transport system permease small subunit